MSQRIEDYAVIGNCETLALVGRNGSIDWLGMPRFDSPSCFASLLGNRDHGRWLISPKATPSKITRRYQGDTLILETHFSTEQGEVILIDFMSRRDGFSDLVRIVRGVKGSVPMQCELVVRFEYGCAVPWVTRQADGSIQFTAGPERLTLFSDAELRGEDMHTVGEFTVEEGDDICFVMTHGSSFLPTADRLDALKCLEEVASQWHKWSSTFKSTGEYADAVRRSLVTLKALTHWQTGGIVAAGTTSLPEKIGGSRNWDYRYCWLRDATYTLYALLGEGFVREAEAWRGWLLRAVAGSPDKVQIMYGVAGERRLSEFEMPELPGYENSSPVRIGNAAAGQIQLDVYGEVLDTLYVARRAGLDGDPEGWALECALVSHLEKIWNQPDDGIWEVRGGRKQFTHSKVMAWVAFDRAVRSAKEFSLEAPVERWCAIRDEIHAQVCTHGFDEHQNSFVQSFGAKELDASLLLIPLVGFLPPDDPRVVGTLAAIETKLLRDGLVLRYDTGESNDGLPPGEGAFLACSFWLVDNYILQNRIDDARVMFERLLSYRNDVGLLAEEYDPVAGRQLGNFPQAFSHLALINTAHSLSTLDGAARERAAGSSRTG